MIELKGVNKTYKMGGEILYALDKVDLKIAKGEFIAIVGPSGSGKSTLANVIGGLDRPTSGKVFIDNQDLSKAKDKVLSDYRNKKVGFVFQTFNLQPSYTALENVILPLIFSRISVRKRKQRAIDCLTAVGLFDRMKHKPSELSGGQRQRVSIARALACDPEIIIADEPTGNLDTKKSAEIISLLKKLNKERKITLIIITHDANIANEADKIILLQDGKIKNNKQ
jgi:putative ABC transport system ATP-binding protein